MYRIHYIHYICTEYTIYSIYVQNADFFCTVLHTQTVLNIVYCTELFLKLYTVQFFYIAQLYSPLLCLLVYSSFLIVYNLQLRY